MNGLPPGWSQQFDDKHYVYFWNEIEGESVWTHPDHEVLSAVVDLHRFAVQQEDPGKTLRHVLAELEAKASEAITCWNEISRQHMLMSNLLLTLLKDAEMRSSCLDHSKAPPTHYPIIFRSNKI